MQISRLKYRPIESEAVEIRLSKFVLISSPGDSGACLSLRATILHNWRRYGGSNGSNGGGLEI